MLSFSPLSRRSTLSRMTLATGLLVLLTLLLSACGGSNPSGANLPTPTSPPGARACSVSTADLGPGGTSKGTAPNDKATGTITVDGSSVLQPLLAQARTEYLAANTSAKITVNAGGTEQGLTDVEAGTVQIGDSDLFASTLSTTSYTNLTDNQIAVVVFAVVVNPDVAASITNLTTQQIQQIFEGQITNWSSLGGPNEQITVVGNDSTSGIATSFFKYVMQDVTSNLTDTAEDDNTSVDDAVSGIPGAIGYVATGTIGVGGKYKGKAVPVCIDGQKPSPAAVETNAYPFWSIEHMYTKGTATGLAASFIKYVQSSAFQTNDLPGMYFLPVNKLSTAASQSHQS